MARKSTSSKARLSDAPLYQIKITLRHSEPEIWRRVVIRADMPLDQFHDVIQVAMGWTHSHLHQFVIGRGPATQFYGEPDTEFLDRGPEMLDERRFSVADLAPAAKRKFVYEYDFGDSWEHEVLVEKTLPPDAGFKHPVCLGGARACPPEDCGGSWGYSNLLEILADPKHPEHEETREWVGEEFHAEEFCVEDVNEILKQLGA